MEKENQEEFNFDELKGKIRSIIYKEGKKVRCLKRAKIIANSKDFLVFEIKHGRKLIFNKSIILRVEEEGEG